MKILAVVIGLVFIVAIMYILWYAFQYIFKSNPSKKTIEKDIDIIRNDLTPWIQKLIPWSVEEMKLLSLQYKEEFVRRNPTKMRKGILYSIYYEPMIVYAIKEYPGQKHTLLFVRLSNKEFVYHTSPSGTLVYMNNKAFGKMRDHNELLDKQGKNVLGRLLDSSSSMPVIIDNKEVGQVVNRKTIDRINPKAFEFLHAMEPHDEAKFLALSLKEIIMNIEEQ